MKRTSYLFHGYVHEEQGILGLSTTVNHGINEVSPSNKQNIEVKVWTDYYTQDYLTENQCHMETKRTKIKIKQSL